MDLPDKESRIRSGNHAKYKAEIYKETNARLFIESSSKQAREIAKRSGKFVYCFEENRMISPYEVRSLITRIKDKIRRIITKTLKFYRK
jgi:orotate phosphoribosyltransferase